MNTYLGNYVTNEAYTDYHMAHKALILIEAFNLWEHIDVEKEKLRKNAAMQDMLSAGEMQIKSSNSI